MLSSAYCGGPLAGRLGFGSEKVSSYNEGALEFLRQVANQAAVAVDNALKFEDARAAGQITRLLLEVDNSVVRIHRRAELHFRPASLTRPA